MRKLLIASQKVGVGKSTTSINLAVAAAQAGPRVLLVAADPLGGVPGALLLANHSHKLVLRERGLDLDGTLFCEVAPGLDVICPFQECTDSEANLDKLLGLLGSDAFANQYRLAILDGPPFMGLRPRSLFAAADEYIFVLQADAMASRMLPMFLETVKAIHREDAPIVLRGVVLTQPKEERWERDLRRYLGDKALPSTIPMDKQVVEANAEGRPVTCARPQSAAALGYLQIAGSLGLTDAGEVFPPPKMPERMPAAAAKGRIVAKQPAAKTSLALPTMETMAARLVPVRPARPARVPPAAETPRGARPTEGSNTPVQLARPPRRTRSDEKVIRAETPAEAPAVQPSPAPVKKVQLRPWHWWIGGATSVGALGGMVRTPDILLPMAVGLATAAGMVAVLKLTMSTEDK